MVENGNRPELNQVSSTSLSCSIRDDPQWEQISGAVRVTVNWPHSAQCHAGMRWPHQSWREMHQSRMLSIQWKYVLFQFSGTNWMRPSSTAALACSASGFSRMNHCVETNASTMV